MKSTEHFLTLARHFGLGAPHTGPVTPEVRKTKRAAIVNKKTELNTENSGGLRFFYGWIEFPAWAAQLSQLRSGIESACRLARECERHGGTIRLGNKYPNGRWSSLESMFRTHLVPFDCGGEDPIDNTPWEGWWRPGYRHLVITEIASSGEKFVPVGDLQAVILRYHGGALRDAIRVLMTRHENVPPTTLRESQAPANL